MKRMRHGTKTIQVTRTYPIYVRQNLIIPEMTALNSCAREYQIRNCENACLSEEFPPDMGGGPRNLAKHRDLTDMGDSSCLGVGGRNPSILNAHRDLISAEASTHLPSNPGGAALSRSSGFVT